MANKASESRKIFEITFYRSFTVDSAQIPTKKLDSKEAMSIAEKQLKEELDTYGQDTFFQKNTREYDFDGKTRRLVQKPAALPAVPVGGNKERKA